MKTLTVLAAVATVLVLSMPGHAQAPAIYKTADRVDVKFKGPVNNTWYTCATLHVPAGVYEVSYRAVVYSSRKDTGTVDAIVTLDTSSVNVKGSLRSALPAATFVSRDGGSGFRKIATATGQATVDAGADGADLYLKIGQSSGSNWDSLQCLGAAWSPTTISAVPEGG